MEPDFPPMAILFEDVLTAFELVSDGSNEVLLCRRTGRTCLRSEAADIDEIGDELPDGAEDDPNYIAFPASIRSVWARHWPSTLRPNFCRAISTASGTCSADAARTGIFANW